MDISYLLNQDKYEEFAMSDDGSDLDNFINVKTSLESYFREKDILKRKKSEIEEQLLDAILSETAERLTLEIRTSDLESDIEDNLDSSECSQDLLEILEIYSGTFKGFEKIKIEKTTLKRNEIYFMNPDDRFECINYETAQSICFLIIKSIIYRLETIVDSYLDDFKEVNKGLIDKINRENIGEIEKVQKNIISEDGLIIPLVHPKTYLGYVNEDVLKGITTIIELLGDHRNITIFKKQFNGEIFKSETANYCLEFGTDEYIDSDEAVLDDDGFTKEFYVSITINCTGIKFSMELQDYYFDGSEQLNYEMDFEDEIYENGDLQNFENMLEELCRRIKSSKVNIKLTKI